MKLATYKDGSRDGQLVVVSDDLTLAHHASGIVTRMQQLLDDWNFLAPQLQDLNRTLALGKARHAFPFEPRMCMAPLPRAYRLVDAQPPTDEELIGARLAGDGMAGAHDGLPMTEGAAGVDAEWGAQLVLALGDVPQGAGDDQARDGVRLVMLGNQWRHWLQQTLVASSMAWAPVAVTPDELGRGWHRGRLALTVAGVAGWSGAAAGRDGEGGGADAGVLSRAAGAAPGGVGGHAAGAAGPAAGGAGGGVAGRDRGR